MRLRRELDPLSLKVPLTYSTGTPQCCRARLDHDARPCGRASQRHGDASCAVFGKDVGVTSSLQLPSQEIARQLLAGRATLVLGPTASPGADRALTSVLSRIASQLGVSDSEATGQREALLNFASTEVSRDEFTSMLLEALDEQRMRTPAWVRQLAHLPWRTVIDLNWDDIMERVLHAERPIIVATALDELTPALADDLLILKPLGSSARAASIFPSISAYSESVNYDSSFHETLASTIGTSAVVFFGVSPKQIDDFMRAIPNASQFLDVPKYAFVLRSKPERLYERVIETKYRIRVTSISRTALGEATSALQDAVYQLNAPGDSPPDSIVSEHAYQNRIQRIKLVNIGQFNYLLTELAPGWNLILGDNGAGKTTILRAVGALLAGKASKAEPDLLRHDAKEGSIEIDIAGIRHRMTLSRDRGEVISRFVQPTPLETGRLLALGFPALRGATLRTPTGPSDTPDIPRSTYRDLAPLIHNDVDTRFDDFQQWLLNIAVRTQASNEPFRTPRNTEELDLVFRLLSSLTDTVTVTYEGVDVDNWQIMVRINNAVLPLKLLSQGLLGTASWVGTLVRRIVEQRAELGVTQRLSGDGVILLIDELDAHLHPRWQKRIIPALKENFPAMQVLASTHSPLVAGSADPGEVISIDLGADGIGRVERIPELRGWRADQILTGPAFGLETTRDTRTAGLLEEYELLLARGDYLSSEERVRLYSLSETIDRTLPRPQETAKDRRAAQVVDAALDSILRDIPASQRSEIASSARQYLAEVFGGEDA